jgi:hypothetical protein
MTYLQTRWPQSYRKSVTTRVSKILLITLTVCSTCFSSSFKSDSEDLSALPKVINTTYISQSSYWLTFFPLRGFLVFFDLAQIVRLLWLSFKTHILGRTPRDHREFTRPQEFEYSIYYSNIVRFSCYLYSNALLLMVTVVVYGCCRTCFRSARTTGRGCCCNCVLDQLLGLQIPVDVCLCVSCRDWWCKCFVVSERRWNSNLRLL